MKDDDEEIFRENIFPGEGEKTESGPHQVRFFFYYRVGENIVEWVIGNLSRGIGGVETEEGGTQATSLLCSAGRESSRRKGREKSP